MAFTSKDEIGELANWFNVFVDNIQGVMKTVHLNAEGVSSASTQLSSTAADLSKGSKDQKFQTENVASAVVQISQSIADVVNNARHRILRVKAKMLFTRQYRAWRK